MKNGINSVNRRDLLRAVGAGLAVGSIGTISGCLGQTNGTGTTTEITREEATGTVEAPYEEPSVDTSLAGSATGEPSGIESDNMSFEGRYDPREYKPRIEYQPDWIHIFNAGGYAVRVEVFGDDVDDGEPELTRELTVSERAGFKGYGDVRISVIGSSESLVIDADLRDVEIWLVGPIQGAQYWVGSF
ncbi:hypothetical protein halTADL_1317 [Halohasta litchfieldiae]|jgi:hypothetical protein|uniref:Uncharacterized protein n=1 Tax=Halohasta litchfieldiae TaxID=1073996 RepID=A0A1H6Y258_9EURY|nr:hypothetical protein [Halohasta litchfieldiae]ATW88094.1 hypothetical protein halTADL_1317 [Halohasta litchfieldiae]SEJ34546.1 hypothetical protein SAMN05444271_15213 [Halohasta litchfieldiae]